MSINFPNSWAPHTTTFIYSLPETTRKTIYQNKKKVQSFTNENEVQTFEEWEASIKKVNEISLIRWPELNYYDTNKTNSTNQSSQETLKKNKSYSYLGSLDKEDNSIKNIENSDGEDLSTENADEKKMSPSEIWSINKNSFPNEEQSYKTNLDINKIEEFEEYRKDRSQRRRKSNYDYYL